MSMTEPIDFVILWVDDTDLKWLAKKEQYVGISTKEGNTEARYRDWDTLKYWFRGVEKFAPWVRYIHFVTDNQKPEWLNIDHPKLKWVKHTDFIPDEYLPTFNSNAIEWNMNHIPDLAEQFVYFNDDMYLIKETTPRDFFMKNLPCDLPVLGPLIPDSFFAYTLFNNMVLLNRHYSMRKAIKNNLFKWIKAQNVKGLLKLGLYGHTDEVINSVSHHIHISYLKSTFDELWEKETEWIDATCRNKQRTIGDISHWCVRDWQLLSGNFYPRKPIGRLFHTASMSYNNKAMEYLCNQKGKVICLNDSENEKDFECHKKMILEAFINLLPEKSSFEL